MFPSIYGFAQSGTLDNSFDVDGIVTTSPGAYSTAEAVGIQTDGKIVVGATVIFGTNSGITLLRYNANGSLDNTFNVTGVAHTDFNNSTEYCTAVAVQPDGKIVASGYSIDAFSEHFAATVRYNVDGTIDQSFGSGGKVLSQYLNTDSYAQDMILQQDGKIVLCGVTKDSLGKNIMLAIRYNSNGSIDSSFDNDGMVVVDFTGYGADCSSIALQPDGKLVLAGTNNNVIGNSKMVLVRLNTNGSLDNTFDTDGKQNSIANACQAYSTKLQSDGKIIVAGNIYVNNAGTDFIVLRYNTDGSVDSSFGIDGVVIKDVGLYQDFCLSVSVESSGNIILAGASRMSQQADANFTLLRLNSLGILDTSFNSNGIVITPIASAETIINDIAVQPDGKIVAAGYKALNNDSEIMMARYSNTLIPNELPNAMAKSKLITIYPNPFSTATHISSGTNFEGSIIYIINTFGCLVKTIYPVFGNHVLLNGEELPSGNYYLYIVEHDKIVSKSKLTIVR
jgi:uncharacterized delta-60 repeat protein